MFLSGWRKNHNNHSKNKIKAWSAWWNVCGWSRYWLLSARYTHPENRIRMHLYVCVMVLLNEGRILDKRGSYILSKWNHIKGVYIWHPVASSGSRRASIDGCSRYRWGLFFLTMKVFCTSKASGVLGIISIAQWMTESEVESALYTGVGCLLAHHRAPKWLVRK